MQDGSGASLTMAAATAFPAAASTRVRCPITAGRCAWRITRVGLLSGELEGGLLVGLSLNMCRRLL